MAKVRSWVHVTVIANRIEMGGWPWQSWSCPELGCPELDLISISGPVNRRECPHDCLVVGYSRLAAPVQLLELICLISVSRLASRPYAHICPCLSPRPNILPQFNPYTICIFQFPRIQQATICTGTGLPCSQS